MDNVTHISELIRKRADTDLVATDQLMTLPSDQELEHFLRVMGYVMSLTQSQQGAINIGEGKMTIQLDHHMPNEDLGIDDLYVCQSTSEFTPTLNVSPEDVETFKTLLRSMMI